MKLKPLINSLVKVVAAAREYKGTLKGVYTIDDHTALEILTSAGQPVIIKDWQIVGRVHVTEVEEAMAILDDLHFRGWTGAAIADELGVSNQLISGRWMKGQIAQNRINQLKRLYEKVLKEESK